MRTHIISIVKVLFLTVVLGACDTDEEVYQVTDRADAYISSVQLYTADNRNVATQVNIDDANGIINVEVKNGVNRAHLKPRCSLAPEATVTPKMGVWTDFSVPVKYTVISGSGEVYKEYKIIVVEKE